MPRKKGSPNFNLRNARLLKSLSREDVAIMIGTDPSRVAEWELGYSKPRIYAQGKLCALFGMTPKELGFLTEKPIQYQSLFISYAHQDEAVAKRLHTDLRKNDV